MLAPVATRNEEGARAWHEFGCALAALGQRRDACRAFRNALLLDDRRADTWLALGKLLVDVGLPERALPTFDRAEQLGCRLPLSFTIRAVPRDSGDCPCVLPPVSSPRPSSC
ncbi:MAG TPA: hypothetical protein VMF52_11495 [Steroidobacteraceae bacterium]|nr:hypothetical protein [Steroidobacteraceae bacterium]